MAAGEYLLHEAAADSLDPMLHRLLRQTYWRTLPSCTVEAEMYIYGSVSRVSLASQAARRGRQRGGVGAGFAPSPPLRRILSEVSDLGAQPGSRG